MKIKHIPSNIIHIIIRAKDLTAKIKKESLLANEEFFPSNRDGSKICLPFHPDKGGFLNTLPQEKLKDDIIYEMLFNDIDWKHIPPRSLSMILSEIQNGVRA